MGVAADEGEEVVEEGLVVVCKVVELDARLEELDEEEVDEIEDVDEEPVESRGWHVAPRSPVLLKLSEDPPSIDTSNFVVLTWEESSV